MKQTNENAARAWQARKACLVNQPKKIPARDQSAIDFWAAKETKASESELLETCAIDTLANLRHLCDKLGLCYGDLDSMAHTHYREEIAEQIALEKASQ